MNLSILFTIIAVFTIVFAIVTISALRDVPTGGSITISPSYFNKATAHIKPKFDASVVSSFSVAGMSSTPLPSLKPCLITYDDVKLATFSESDITYAALPSNSSQTAIHQITIHQPAFTLKTLPYTAACNFNSGVGLLKTEASGSIQGNWSADKIVVTVTETISNASGASHGAVVVSAATLMTTVGMQLEYDYNAIEGVSQQGFIFDDFWKHHVEVTLQAAVNAEIESLFKGSGQPIALIANNMNSLFSQWQNACSIDQNTLPGTIIINTHPLCETQSIDGLPADDLRIVQVSNASSSVSSSSSSSTSACTPTSGICWNPTAYPNDGKVFISYTKCVQCTLNHANITGTAGTVVFTANQ